MTEQSPPRSGPPPRRRARYLESGETAAPEPISNLLGTVFEKVSRVDRRAVSLVEEWDEIAGSAWRGTRPRGLRNGVLTVEVASGSAASLLRFEVPELQMAIGRRFGADLVTGVRLRVAGRE